MLEKSSDNKNRRIVILVHGIRDHGLWQDRVKPTLEDAGFRVITTTFGRLNLLRFLAPIDYFRNRATTEIKEQIDSVKTAYPGAEISVIAHSFGTYIISRILQKDNNARFMYLIFCGAVLKKSFDPSAIRFKFKDPIVSEVGTRDIWPAIAESVTTDYLPSGSFGFRKPFVEDRWHSKSHSEYLTKEFCTEFWLPFLESGNLVRSDAEILEPVWWIKLIHVLKLKYAVALMILGFAWFNFPNVVNNFDSNFKVNSMTDDTGAIVDLPPVLPPIHQSILDNIRFMLRDDLNPVVYYKREVYQGALSFEQALTMLSFNVQDPQVSTFSNTYSENMIPGRVRMLICSEDARKYAEGLKELVVQFDISTDVVVHGPFNNLIHENCPVQVHFY